jgi:hypothetical protein
MLVFASSDKGGTGRTVTACNVAYQLSLMGKDIAYLDFDFGSPTAGAIFEMPSVERGTEDPGLHSYLLGRSGSAPSVDVRRETARREMKTRPPGAGRLALYPGDRGGAEFPLGPGSIVRVASLLRSLEREFDVCIVDLSAGRSTAVELCIRALASPPLNESAIVRWLVFHRWTRQHVLAASGLIYGDRGILQVANDAGHHFGDFRESLRTVRTAVPDLNSAGAADSPAQAAWLRSCDAELKTLAREFRLGQSVMLGQTPLEPMLLWREQIVTDADVSHKLANAAALEAFKGLAEKLTASEVWEGI